MSTTTRVRTLLFIQHPEHVLFIGPHFSANTVAALIRSRGIVLWDNEGAWGMLTRTQLQDLLEQHEMAQVHNEKYPRVPFKGMGIQFCNTVAISAHAARALRLNSGN